MCRDAFKGGITICDLKRRLSPHRENGTANSYETGSMKIYLDKTSAPRFSLRRRCELSFSSFATVDLSRRRLNEHRSLPFPETADPQFFAGSLAYSSGVLASQLALRLNCSSIEGSQWCLTHPGSGDAAQPVRAMSSASWKISRTNIVIVYSTFPAAESCPYLHRGPEMSTLAASARA